MGADQNGVASPAEYAQARRSNDPALRSAQARTRIGKGASTYAGCPSRFAVNKRTRRMAPLTGCLRLCFLGSVATSASRANSDSAPVIRLDTCLAEHGVRVASVPAPPLAEHVRALDAAAGMMETALSSPFADPHFRVYGWINRFASISKPAPLSSRTTSIFHAPAASRSV